MSTFMNLILSTWPGAQALLEKVTVTTSPEDDVEGLEWIPLHDLRPKVTDALEIVVYQPPAGMSRAEGYHQGHQWFQEDLAHELHGALQELSPPPDAAHIYLLSYEDMSCSMDFWDLTPTSFVRRYYGDGEAFCERLDEDGAFSTESADVSVDPDPYDMEGDNPDEDGYFAELERRQAPFSGWVVLAERHGITLEHLNAALHNRYRERWVRLWPRDEV